VTTRSTATKTRRETSAGLLVYRRGPALEILLAHPGGPFWAKKDAGAWSIPNGIVESENLLACARREFREETGIDVDGEFAPLHPVKQKSGKVVHAWAIEADLDLTETRSNLFTMEWPPRSGTMQSFPEIDRVAYFDMAHAEVKILSYQKPWLAELATLLA